MINVCNRNKLISRLNKVFDSAKYPKSISIVYDPKRVSLECEEIHNFFVKKKWEDITLDVLLREYPGDHSACPFFMTDEAKKYYLPAYIKIVLEDFVKADMIVETVIRLLTPPEKQEEMDEYRMWAELFNNEERLFIYDFLSCFVSMTEDVSNISNINSAINYWGKLKIKE